MKAGPETPLIFVADDDGGLLQLIEKALRRERFATASASSGRDTMNWLRKNRATLMLLDLKLPDLQGKEIIAGLKEAGRCPPFIIITGQGDERVAVEMMKCGAMDYLVKDVDFLQFVPAVVRRALEQIDKERRLGEAEEQVHLIRSVVEQGFSAVLITTAESADPRVVYINPAFARATGYTAEQVVGKPISTLGNLTNVLQRLRAGMPAGVRFVEEFSTFKTAAGERLGEWRIGPVTDKAGTQTHWLIIFRDITERRRLEKEILEISDREQQRLGQDLHDGLCQHLAGIELMAQSLEHKLGARSKATAARVSEIAAHVRDAIGQTRLLARGLSPVTLESEGLMSALQELCSNAEKLFGVKCDFACDHPVLVRNPAATHLYRIAQEAVSNAVKHGKAKQIKVQLQANGGQVLLSILDNGAGFSPPRPDNKGMGLRIMQYRAGIIGGALSIENRTAEGTVVVCSAPMHQARTF